MLKARSPHFYHLFSSNFSSQRLEIPEAFVKHMEGRTSGTVLLVGPSGNTWRVDLTRWEGAWFFGEGWPGFVRDHFIECGDFLVFRHDGGLHFTVQVFDKSTCEKESSFHSQCSQDPGQFDWILGQKRDREDGVVSHGHIYEGLPKKSRDGNEVLYLGCENKIQQAEVHGSDNFRLDGTSQEANLCQKTKQFDEKTETVIQKRNGKEDDLNLLESGCLSTLTEYEEKKVAQSFTSSLPFFVRIMKRFNVSGSYTLNIPYQFAMEHLPKCKTEIVLRNVKGAYWAVNSVPTTRVHTSHTFCGGWLAFVRSNEIRVGDICIFELVHNCEFRVHVLRVGKEDADVQNGKSAFNGLNMGTTSTKQKLLAEFACKSIKNSKAHSKSLKKVLQSDQKRSKASEKSKYGSSARKSASVALCSMSRRDNEKPEAALGGLRMMLALDEEKAARSFASGFPNFVRIMRKFNVSGSFTLKIPYKFSMAYLPDCKTEIVLRNLQGQCWTVNSVPDSKGRMVHTFCGGWMAFVRDNDIKMGDICIFELVSKCEMRVHISGVGRIGIDHHQHGSS